MLVAATDVVHVLDHGATGDFLVGAAYVLRGLGDRSRLLGGLLNPLAAGAVPELAIDRAAALRDALRQVRHPPGGGVVDDRARARGLADRGDVAVGVVVAITWRIRYIERLLPMR